MAELDHTWWISSGEIMPTLIQAEQPGFWFGHDHVVPQAYLGMVPWLVVKAPGGTPEAAKQEQQLLKLQEEHLRLVQNPNQKYPLPSMHEMHAMETPIGVKGPQGSAPSTSHELHDH